MRLLSLFSALLLLTACLPEQQPSAPMAPPQGALPVKVITADTREVVEWDEFTGRFRAAQRVEIRARVSGYVDEIRFQDGQIVEQGDVLFVIDPRPFQIAVNSAKATLDLYNKELERAKGLLETKTISKDTYDKRFQDREVSQAAYDDALLQLEWTQVKAPFGGRVSRNFVDIGNLISGGDANATLLTTIVSVDPIEFYFEGSEADVLKYSRLYESNERDGTRGGAWPVFVKLQDEDDFVHEGSINFVDNALDFDTGTKQVRAVFDNSDGFLQQGLFGRLRLTTTKPFEALVVPDALIGTEQTRKYVYTIGPENRATRSYLTLGTLTEDGMRIVRSGLEASDQIIAGNLQMIQPGMQVQPVTGDGPKPGP